VKLPDDLRARVTADLHPVRPLLRPWQRAMVIAPAAALVWAAGPGLFGLRGDIGTVGPWLAWGGSIAQLAVAVALIVAALREAVPAENVSRSSARVLLATGVVITVILAILTNWISPESRPRAETFESWFYCWEGALVVGAPLVLMLAVLLARGLPMRPGLAGALAGMGAGAAVDGGWRRHRGNAGPRAANVDQEETWREPPRHRDTGRLTLAAWVSSPSLSSPPGQPCTVRPSQVRSSRFQVPGSAASCKRCHRVSGPS
jgi:hypothetical protein